MADKNFIEENELSQQDTEMQVCNCSNCGFGARTHEVFPASCPNYRKGKHVHCLNWESQ